jgi:hypothetical protein
VTTPDWLREGAVVWDWDDERWEILALGPQRVTVGHPDRGRHELLREDLVAWVESGEWETTE